MQVARICIALSTVPLILSGVKGGDPSSTTDLQAHLVRLCCAASVRRPAKSSTWRGIVLQRAFTSRWPLAFSQWQALKGKTAAQMRYRGVSRSANRGDRTRPTGRLTDLLVADLGRNGHYATDGGGRESESRSRGSGRSTLKCLPVDVSHLSFACRNANRLITRWPPSQSP
jgi:hypothetical protein